MNRIFPSGMMAIDLSHTLAPGMPYFPGTEPPVFSRPFTVASHGFAEQKITMLTHSGTHMDAPAHLFAAGATLEQLGLPHFVGSAAGLGSDPLARPVSSTWMSCGLSSTCWPGRILSSCARAGARIGEMRPTSGTFRSCPRRRRNGWPALISRGSAWTLFRLTPTIRPLCRSTGYFWPGTSS